MDIGRPLLFIPIAIFCFYSFKKSKQNIYLILAALAWSVAIYSGKLNIYQTLEQPLKPIVNFMTILIVLVMFIPYLRQSIKEYKNHKGRKE